MQADSLNYIINDSNKIIYISRPSMAFCK